MSNPSQELNTDDNSFVREFKAMSPEEREELTITWIREMIEDGFRAQFTIDERAQFTIDEEED